MREGPPLVRWKDGRYQVVRNARANGGWRQQVLADIGHHRSVRDALGALEQQEAELRAELREFERRFPGLRVAVGPRRGVVDMRRLMRRLLREAKTRKDVRAIFKKQLWSSSKSSGLRPLGNRVGQLA